MCWGGIFQDKPLEFLSSFLLKKSSEKSEEFEGNDILLGCDPCDVKVTSDPLTKVNVAVAYFSAWCLSVEQGSCGEEILVKDDRFPGKFLAANCFTKIVVADY